MFVRAAESLAASGRAASRGSHSDNLCGQGRADKGLKRGLEASSGCRAGSRAGCGHAEHRLAAAEAGAAGPGRRGAGRRRAAARAAAGAASGGSSSCSYRRSARHKVPVQQCERAAFLQPQRAPPHTISRRPRPAKRLAAQGPGQEDRRKHRELCRDGLQRAARRRQQQLI